MCEFEYEYNFKYARNHPSGNLLPSEQDKQLTQRQSCGYYLNIPVLNHLILIVDGNCCFADEGDIKMFSINPRRSRRLIFDLRIKPERILRDDGCLILVNNISIIQFNGFFFY
ncbi:JAB domain-containing protein [Algoriphagus sp. D3-2-R+10]|uniref:JAB domain-containing protein n=1 Tax=Algoriphagus aurantiacus TaxID=3103948 RepID=UPI002B3DAE9E|nr:JAB domain-containing protein [Algoriphagus sp. D3-2-R+10]MEB2778107.1 JAB domain-containing protein [Algoriphagus sp. D3-2-R+10]